MTKEFIIAIDENGGKRLYGPYKYQEVKDVFEEIEMSGFEGILDIVEAEKFDA